MTENFENIISNRFTAEVMCTRFCVNSLVSSTMTFSMEYAVNPDASADDVITSWRKIEHFFESLDQSLMVCASNPVGVAVAIDTKAQRGRFSNRLVLTPEEPVEDHVSFLMLSKMNAIGGDIIAFGGIEVSSRESCGFSFAMLGCAANYLPMMAEWMGTPNWFKEPWWSRDDATTIDSIAPVGTDVSVPPEWFETWDFLTSPRPQNSGVVIKGKFKPRLVEGLDDGDPTE